MNTNVTGGPLGYFTGQAGSMLNISIGEVPVLGFHCLLINYGEQPVFIVELPFRVSFFEAIITNVTPNSQNVSPGAQLLARDWIVEIPKIDSGIDAQFEFLVYTLDRYVVLIDTPKTVAFQIDASGSRQMVPLIQAPFMPIPLSPPMGL